MTNFEKETLRELLFMVEKEFKTGEFDTSFVTVTDEARAKLAKACMFIEASLDYLK